MGIAKNICDKVKVGANGTCTAGTAGVSGLEAFQAVVDEFEALEAAGIVAIIERHRESQSGHRHIDQVRFRRLR
jgi:hypothetical protein